MPRSESFMAATKAAVQIDRTSVKTSKYFMDIQAPHQHDRCLVAGRVSN